MIYVASPYSGTPEEMSLRYELVEDFVWHMGGVSPLGEPLFSPIMYFHNAALRAEGPTAAVAYAEFNRGMLAVANTLWILNLPEWNKSQGVRMEYEWAEGKPRYLVTMRGEILREVEDADWPM